MKKILLFLSVLIIIPVIGWSQSSHPPLNGIVTITSSSPTYNQQMPNLPSQTCTFVVDPYANTGCVYLGGYNVTNSSGINPGISLGNGCDGPSLSNLTVYPNLDSVFMSTDTNGNKVKWICN